MRARTAPVGGAAAGPSRLAAGAELPEAWNGMVPPEQTPEITEALLRRGYGEADIRAILGGNFLRIAETVWR